MFIVLYRGEASEAVGIFETREGAELWLEEHGHEWPRHVLDLAEIIPVKNHGLDD